ncbi:MAG: glycosyltransferase family 39 protein [Deltaproteobacteria bacterium]|nr:glycosyltransferase family 39 protein [Deltaproteobacteria bacterium]
MGAGAASNRWWTAAAAAAVLLALALRLWGLAWGAPFVYHPDEHFILHRALDIVRERDLNPHWFQYPTLPIYLEALLVLALQPIVYAPLTTNSIINGIGPWDALPEQWPFVLAGRVAVALSGVAGVALLFAGGRRWHSGGAGAAAALLLAVMPLHLESSHYLTTDVPAVALIAATIWVSLRADSASAPAAEPVLRWLVAGLCAGFAAATKYTAGFVLLVPVLLASDLRRPRASARRLFYIAAGALGAFLLACPYSLIDLAGFLRGLEEQQQNYLTDSTPGRAWYWYAVQLWSYELQPGAAAAALVGAGFAVHRARRADVALLLPPLIYYAVVALFPSRPERNLIPLLPFACLFAGRALAEVCYRLFSPRLASAAIAVVALSVALPPARQALRANAERARPDTRSLAHQWVSTNVPEGSCLAREEYTPQLPATRYQVHYLWSLAQRPYSWYLEQKCDYLVASSNIYGRVHGPPYFGGPTAAEFYRVLFSLPRVAEFNPGPSASGPTIRIFKLPRGQ